MPNGLAVFSVAFGALLSHMVLKCQTVPECGPPPRRLEREGMLQLQGLLKLLAVRLPARHCEPVLVECGLPMLLETQCACTHTVHTSSRASKKSPKGV